MKNRIALIILVVACVGLGIGLIVVTNRAGDQHTEDQVVIGRFSNQVVQTTAKLEDVKQTAARLEQDLDKQKRDYLDLTNSYAQTVTTLTQTSSRLTQTSNTLTQTDAALKASQAELAKANSAIADLEARNSALDTQAQNLSIEITNKNLQIASIERKLAASEGDKAFLTKELSRLMHEKAELERQFNDLTVLRAQVAKLKEELNIARRIEWIRKGLFASADTKGAQQLMQGINAPAPQPQVKPASKPAYDLNVEVSADGSVKVIPPATNSAPAGGTSPK